MRNILTRREMWDTYCAPLYDSPEAAETARQKPVGHFLLQQHYRNNFDHWQHILGFNIPGLKDGDRPMDAVSVPKWLEILDGTPGVGAMMIKENITLAKIAETMDKGYPFDEKIVTIYYQAGESEVGNIFPKSRWLNLEIERCRKNYIEFMRQYAPLGVLAFKIAMLDIEAINWAIRGGLNPFGLHTFDERPDNHYANSTKKGT